MGRYPPRCFLSSLAICFDALILIEIFSLSISARLARIVTNIFETPSV
jgi:hypothetical protein